MTEYDQRCAADFAALRVGVDKFFIELQTSCPYGLPHTACFYQAMFGPLNERAMELFLAAGYRRNGNCLYSMYCRECSACIPMRLRVTDFCPNRNQRRVQNRNGDLEIDVDYLQVSGESLELCDRFLQSRSPQEYNTADGYYGGFFCNNIVDSAQVQFRLAGRLVGTSIVDVGANWMNAVYFFFDPDEKKRSLGTYNILTLINICRERDIEYLYLGYYIAGVSAMSYKENFRPHQFFLQKKWQTEK